jgi:hypothetical protein
MIAQDRCAAPERRTIIRMRWFRLTAPRDILDEVAMAGMLLRSACVVLLTVSCIDASSAQSLARPTWTQGDTWRYRISLLPAANRGGTFTYDGTVVVRIANPTATTSTSVATMGTPRPAQTAPSDTRSTSTARRSPTRAGTANEDRWYAPDVKRHIKHERYAVSGPYIYEHWVEELTSFELR